MPDSPSKGADQAPLPPGFMPRVTLKDPKTPKLAASSASIVLPQVTFKALFELGWPELIPIIPPKAKLAPFSKIQPQALGKIPGLMTDPKEKVWAGVQWRRIDTSSADNARRWDAMGASIGHRCGELVGLDCDIGDKDLARKALDICCDHLGLPDDVQMRIGRKPRWLIPVRVAGGDAKSWNLVYRHPMHDEPLGFQLLGPGKQFVLWGIHPGTSKPYQWYPRRPGKFIDLPKVAPAQLESLAGVLSEWLVGEVGAEVQAHSTHAHVDPRTVNQETLKGDKVLVEAAVRATPNDLDEPAWFTYLCALQAASADWPEGGLALWREFSARWLYGDDDPGRIDAAWQRMKGEPKAVGADLIYQMAAEKGGWNRAVVDFGAIVSADEIREANEKGADDEELFTARAGAAHLPAVAVSEDTRWADKALAHRFVEEHAGRLLYCGERRAWLAWDGKRWAVDSTNAAADLAVQKFLNREAFRFKATAPPAIPQIEVARTLHRLKGLNAHKAVKALIQSPLTVSVEFLDTDPRILNTQDGIVDLRTGNILPRNDRPLVTRITRVGLDPEPPVRWLKFLDEITQGDEELVDYLHRALGYSLWGELPEATLYFVYGPGGNGKSVLLNTLMAVLGDYATVADRAAFLRTRNEQHATIRASLAGYRFVQVPELNAGAEWNEAILKEFSAGDWVKARFMRQDEFRFKPAGTLWFAGNDKPSFANINPAIERRFRLIELDYVPASPDLHLQEKLVSEEGPRILSWLIEGCLKWQRDGLGTSKAVARATEEYFAEGDPLRRFVREQCLIDPHARDGSRAIYQNFLTWCKAESEDIMSEKVFVLNLRKSFPGIAPIKTSSTRLLKGIRRKVMGVESNASTGRDAEGVMD